MGFYPVEVLVNDAKRHGVAVLPVDINASTLQDDHRMGRAAGVGAGEAADSPRAAGIDARPEPVASLGAASCPGAEARERWAAESATGWGVRLGLHLVKGIGEQHEELLDAELARGPYVSLADVVERTGLPEEAIERLIRTGALDSLGRPRRELLWQLREVAGATRGRVDGRRRARRAAVDAGGRPADGPAAARDRGAGAAGDHRVGAARRRLRGGRARRPAPGRRAVPRGARSSSARCPNAALADRRPGRVRIGGLVVTRQHPMTAKGTVFLALEDETGMVNVTLWPDTWARLRGVVRRHALLLVDGRPPARVVGRERVAHEVRALPEVGGHGRRPGTARRRPPAGPRRDAPARS